MRVDINPLITVILPVWNPGPGISRCIESLRKQTLKEIEMIFVDDCGTDDSMDKVRAAADEDKRIRIIYNEENIGAGPSRNKAIEEARGEYLSFVDADDYIDEDFLELLFSASADQAYDIVKGSIVLENEKGILVKKPRCQNEKIRKGLEAKKPLYTLYTYEHQSAIYRRVFINSNGIRYGSSARAQDDTFLLMACSKATSFKLVEQAHYHFCERLDSAMHIKDATKLLGYLESVKQRVNYILESIVLDLNAKEYLRTVLLFALREYTRYDSAVISNDTGENYKKNLQSVLRSLPCCKEFVNKSFCLRVLLDYGECLPPIPYYYPWESDNPPQRYAELVKRWIDFIKENPKEERASKEELIKVCGKAVLAVRGIPGTTFSRAERKKGKTQLKKQIARLPLSTKLLVQLSPAVLLVSKAFPNRFKVVVKNIINRGL